MFCFHATQQHPCQNWVYTYPGAHWDFLSSSFPLLSHPAKKSHIWGGGVPTGLTEGEDRESPTSEQPMTANDLPPAIFSQTIQQEMCRHHGTNQNTIGNAEEMFLANMQSHTSHTALSKQTWTWICVLLKICILKWTISALMPNNARCSSLPWVCMSKMYCAGTSREE